MQSTCISTFLDLNYFEVAKAIRYKRSANFSAQEAEEAFTQVVDLINLFGAHIFGEVVLDAMVYDAAFLVLADKLDIQLLTLDVKFAKKLETTKYRGLIEHPNKESLNRKRERNN